MIVIAGGDSFVWGSELKDSLHSGPNGHSINTFTALLANEYEYNCVALPGNGNDSIARMTMIACENNKHKKQFVIVGWTFPGRYEFHFQTTKGPRWEVINSWSVGRHYQDDDIDKNTLVDFFKSKADLLGIRNFAESYFANIGFLEYWQTCSTLKEIIFLQNYLKLHQIPYLFTCMDTNFLHNHTSINPDESIKVLYQQIDFDPWYLFPAGYEAKETRVPRGFYQWAVENKYKIGSTHPLEDAHIDAAGLIKEKFNELVKKTL